MLNFIIYEGEEKYRDKYFSVVDKFIGSSNLAYDVTEIKEYTNKVMDQISKIGGSKIFILDVEVPGKSGLDLAKQIRDSGDWDSQIIILTAHDNLRNYNYQREILMLAFITKLYDLEELLLEAIRSAHNILTSRDSIQFKKNNKVYRVPLADILYIEKVQEETYCLIHTKNDKYITNKTLLHIEKILAKDPRFIKTHRNYIVNTYNIRGVDLEDLIIKFDNNKIAFLSKNYKKALKEKLSKELFEQEHQS